MGLGGRATVVTSLLRRGNGVFVSTGFPQCIAKCTQAVYVDFKLSSVSVVNVLQHALQQLFAL